MRICAFRLARLFALCAAFFALLYFFRAPAPPVSFLPPADCLLCGPSGLLQDSDALFLIDLKNWSTVNTAIDGLHKRSLLYPDEQGLGLVGSLEVFPENKLITGVFDLRESRAPAPAELAEFLCAPCAEKVLAAAGGLDFLFLDSKASQLHPLITEEWSRPLGGFQFKRLYLSGAHLLFIMWQ